MTEKAFLHKRRFFVFKNHLDGPLKTKFMGLFQSESSQISNHNLQQILLDSNINPYF